MIHCRRCPAVLGMFLLGQFLQKPIMPYSSHLYNFVDKPNLASSKIRWLKLNVDSDSTVDTDGVSKSRAMVKKIKKTSGSSSIISECRHCLRQLHHCIWNVSAPKQVLNSLVDEDEDLEKSYVMFVFLQSKDHIDMGALLDEGAISVCGM